MKKINPKELHDKLTDGENDGLLVDVREPFEFKAKHIQGSENIPLEKLGDSISKLKTVKSVYVHCQSGNRSNRACLLLENAGVNVINVEGGIVGWEAEGFSVEGDGTHVIPIIRQVMVVAGLLILIGNIMGTIVNSWWYLLSLGMGAGLLFAGITGICAMSNILKYMPWNRD